MEKRVEGDGGEKKIFPLAFALLYAANKNKLGI
jgi:hypothetical protein